MIDMESPLISIVMSCYNHEKFVTESLNGEFAQTRSPLDIDDVYDCSQDRTAGIASAKLTELPGHSNIRFFRNLPPGSGGSSMLAISRGVEIDR
jgi:glycosyltransferase involved in cell wall biosynthesis